jgi:hypothetical protein
MAAKKIAGDPLSFNYFFPPPVIRSMSHDGDTSLIQWRDLGAALVQLRTYTLHLLNGFSERA